MKKIEQAIEALRTAARHAVHEELETEYTTSANALRDLLGRVTLACEHKSTASTGDHDSISYCNVRFKVLAPGTYRVWFERVEDSDND